MKLMILALAALFFAPAANALQHNLNLDQGVDLTGLVTGLKAEAKTAAAPEVKAASVRPLFLREERDCADISFGPNDPLRSGSVRLESRIYEEICRPDHRDIPRPPRDGRNGPGRGNPRAHSVDGKYQAQQNCYERFVRSERRTVQVEIAGRSEMYPWERDVFEVCLQGNWLTTRTRNASYQYDIDNPGYSGGTILARAVRKVQTLPDPAGIQDSGFAFDAAAGSFVFGLRDRWIEYYNGEQVTFQVKLRRYYKNWFDSTVLEKEFTVPASEAYRVNFADYAAELSGDLTPGKEYYVEWKFRRRGAVSKDDWVKSRETGRASYQGTLRSMMVSFLR